jgi:hypothetical protein
MLNRLNSEQNGLVSEVIRDANQIFLGVGVYTVVKLFFLAGNVEPYCQVVIEITSLFRSISFVD